MKQYRQIKSRHPDCILFFRLGDFYEMFYEDAEIAARELELVLTTRGGRESAPMCGVPCHAVEGYLARLVSKGYKVAICEQMEDPKKAKGLVKREVVRIVTPGTVMEDRALPEKDNNYLASMAKDDNGFALAWADVSTGEFRYSYFQEREGFLEEIARLQPAEYLLPPGFTQDKSLLRWIKIYAPGTLTPWPVPSREEAEERLRTHFKDKLQVEGPEAVWRVLAQLLSFLQATQGDNLIHLEPPREGREGQSMVLDQATRKNLELLATSREGKREGSLLWILDRTLTAMGARTLKRWLESPLVEVSSIKARQGAVGELVESFILREELRRLLGGIRDMERLGARVAGGLASPRDLAALRNSLAQVPPIKDLLAGARSQLLSDLRERLDLVPELAELLERSLVEDPPATLEAGWVIKPGFNPEIDRLRQAVKHGKEWIASLEERERQRTGIKSLKVGYNRVFGYYIEVTKPNLSQVPPHYQRRQTLVNAERFVTPELLELEQQILGAEERLLELERQVWEEILDRVRKELPRLQNTARVLGVLDVLQSLATVAAEYNYTCPEVDESLVIHIQQGRHPVVERVGESLFVPNDTYMDEKERIHIITGPNMAGKSTYIRQVALIVLLAQMGSFVPARKARIGVVDRIFTRVGAADDIFSGQSTFMVEMQEVAHILRNATSRSLVILDEVGRGTGTSDGLSLAQAITEYLHDAIQARTLFATHYHELVSLAETLPAVKNYYVAVKEEGEEVVFLHTILPGSMDKSYGIHVARLAGLPPAVIERAQKLLENSEEEKGQADPGDGRTSGLEEVEKRVLRELALYPLMAATPLQAMEQIFRWQQLLRERDFQWRLFPG